MGAILCQVFLVADTKFYKRLCPSVGSLVRQSRSSCHARVVTLELKTQKRIFMMLKLVLFVCECVGGGLGVWWGSGWGLDSPAHPSATLLWPRVTFFIIVGRGFRFCQRVMNIDNSHHYGKCFIERYTFRRSTTCQCPPCCIIFCTYGHFFFLAFLLLQQKTCDCQKGHVFLTVWWFHVLLLNHRVIYLKVRQN